MPMLKPVASLQHVQAPKVWLGSCLVDWCFRDMGLATSDCILQNYWGPPCQVLIACVLLLGWMEASHGGHTDFDMLDLFCGQQAMSKVWP